MEQRITGQLVVQAVLVVAALEVMAQNLELLINRVEPSFIRIEADELTYPAHVILRQKLEKAFFYL